MDEEEEVEVWDQATRESCSHTHSCNPQGPKEASHTHTCFHSHTQLIIHDPLEKDHSHSINKKRSCGNREAVKKYREKKKARTLYLEEEVKRLQSLNQHLIRKLERQEMVETEFIRLRTLLVEMQVKIDDEIGGFSLHNQCNGSGLVFKEDGCNIATRDTMCEASRLECEETQTLHHDNIHHSFIPHSPPFSH
ncbi:unnamed protein product [Cochlearia groenlandica]